MSVLIGSRTQHCTLRSRSCFFTELFKLHSTDFFSPPLYQCLLAHNAVSIRSVLSPQQNESSPSNRRAFWKILWRLLLETICQCCVRQSLNVYCLSCANHKCLFCIMETCLKSVNSVCQLSFFLIFEQYSNTRTALSLCPILGRWKHLEGFHL